MDLSLKHQDSAISHRKIPKYRDTHSFFNEENFEDVSELESGMLGYEISSKDRQLLENSLDYPPNKTFFCETFPEVRESLFQDFERDEKVICFALSQGNLAFASSNSIITIFDLKTKVRRKLKLDKEKDSPTALDITYDEEVLCLGFASGLLSFYELLTMKLLKSFPKFHLTRILCLKFYHNLGHSSKEARLLVSDAAQNVNKVVFEKGIFGYDADETLLIRDWGQFFRIEILNNTSGFWEKTRIAALASIKQVAIVSLEPKPFRIMSFYRPEQINERTIPYINWNEGVSMFKPNAETCKEGIVGKGDEEIQRNIMENNEGGDKGEFLSEMEREGLLAVKSRENSPKKPNANVDNSKNPVPEIKIIEDKLDSQINEKKTENLSKINEKPTENQPFSSMKSLLFPKPSVSSLKTIDLSSTKPGSSKIITSKEDLLNQQAPVFKGFPSTFLAVLWGSVVFLIRIYSGNEKLSFQHRVESFYQLNYLGLLCFFLNEKLLLILEAGDDTLTHGELSNIDSYSPFQAGENLSSSFFLNNFGVQVPQTTVEVQPLSLSLPISFQTVLKDSQNMLLSTKLLNFARIPHQNRVIYCHETTAKVLELGVLGSQDFFAAVLRGGDADFSRVLFDFLNIYQGKTSFLRDNPENDVLVIESLVQGFVRDFLQDKSLAFGLVFLLVRTRNFGFLFSEVLVGFQEHGREEEFFMILETFISRKEVDYIPEKSLRTVVSYYSKRGMVALVHELVFALDYQRVDVCPIITLCLEFHLLRGLIYVSTVFGEDFITPLIKIFSLYEALEHDGGEVAREIERDRERYKENQGKTLKNEEKLEEKSLKNEENEEKSLKNEEKSLKNEEKPLKSNDKSPKTSIETLHEAYLKEPTAKKRKDFGGQCLKYLALCFRKRLINNQEIPDDKYALVLQMLIIWVFEPENLRKLHEIDTQLFFEAIFLLFSNENGAFLLNFRTDDLKILTEASWLLEIEAQNNDFKTQNYLLIGLMYLRNKEELWLSLLIGRIVNLKRLYLPAVDCLRAMKVLLENPELLDYYIEQDWQGTPMGPVDFDKAELKKCDFLIEILNYVQGKVEESALDAVLALQEVSL